MKYLPRIKLLLIAYEAPSLPLFGGPQRTQMFLNVMRSIGDVDTLYLNSPNLQNKILREKKSGFTKTTYDVISRFARAVEFLLLPLLVALGIPRIFRRMKFGHSAPGKLAPLININDYNLVVCRYIQCAIECGIPMCTRLIIDCDDFQPPTRPALWDAHARILLNEARGLIFLTKESSGQPKPSENVAIIPNSIFIEVNQEPGLPYRESQGSTILICGYISNPAFLTSVAWYIKFIWPIVVKAVPSARLKLIGRGDWTPIRELTASDKNIVALGEVDEVSRHYSDCCFSISPIHKQLGSSIKLVESLFMGRTVVASRSVHKGVADWCRHEDHILAFETVSDCAQHCIRLLTDTAFRRKLEIRGMQSAFDHVHPKKIQQQLADFLKKNIQDL